MRKGLTISSGLIGASTLGMLIAAILQDREQRALISSGVCEAREEAWHQPPSDWICISESSEGGCLMWSEIRHDPYLRTYWVCETGQSFWRRKVEP